MSLTNYPNGISSFGVPVIGGVGGIPFSGKYYFVDYANGADGNDGSAELPMKTLQAAHDRCTSGNNDVVILVGSGNTTKTQRLSTTLTWSKDAVHLIGLCAPTAMAQRARIAPVLATEAFANFITISGSGCYFANFSIFHGFDTGTTNAIACTVSGSRNAFVNVDIGGMGDAASAQNAGSRSLKVTGSENTFLQCAVGLDTVTRTVANASLEFASASARNVFRGCLFPFMTSSATAVGIKVAAAGGIDRFNLFDGCVFANATGSTSTTMTGVAMLAASAGGYLLFKNCTAAGISHFGYDATSYAQALVDGAVPTGATSGLAVASA